MRVFHVVPAFFGPDGIVGGAERYALELARAMADAVPTTLIAFGDRARDEQLGSLRVRVLAGAWHVRGHRSNPFHWKLFALLRDAAVVHCHQQHVLTSSAVAAWGRLTGRPVFVSDLGGGGWDISAYVSTDGWYRGHLHISEYSRHVHDHDRRADAHVILGGVDTERFSPDPGVTRPPAALFVGRLRPHKGVDDLIAGIPPGVTLTIAGPEPEPGMAAHLRRLAAGKPVTFKHHLDDAALANEYRRTLCVVLPSVYRAADGTETRVPELLGQTLLEGMACEAPAICTQVASMPEVVDHGVTGFVVPPNDPAAIGARLAWLAAHPDAARAMGRAGRQRVLAHFTWPRVVERCLDAYRAAVPEWAGVPARRDARSRGRVVT